VLLTQPAIFAATDSPTHRHTTTVILKNASNDFISPHFTTPRIIYSMDIIITTEFHDSSRSASAKGIDYSHIRRNID
jgi:hypothetical protein